MERRSSRRRMVGCFVPRKSSEHVLTMILPQPHTRQITPFLGPLIDLAGMTDGRLQCNVARGLVHRETGANHGGLETERKSDELNNRP